MPDATATAATTTPTATASTPTTAAPAANASTSTAPAALPTETQPATPAASQADNAGVDDVDAEWAEFDKGNATAETPAAASKPKPSDTPEDTGDPSDDSDADAALSTEDRDAIKRHGLDPDEIATLRNLTPESRKRFVGNLDKRAKFTDDLQRQLRELQGTAKPPVDNDQGGTDAVAKPESTSTAPPQFEAAWKSVESSFEPYGFGDTVKPIRAAIESYGRSIADNAAKSMRPILDRMEEDDKSAGFDALQLPDGVDKNDEKVRADLIKEADLLLSGNFNIKTFNYRHAIARAAVNLYQTKLQQAEKSRKDRERKASLRGTAEPSTRTPTVAPKLSDDDFEDAALDAVLTGDQRKLESLTA